LSGNENGAKDKEGGEHPTTQVRSHASLTFKKDFKRGMILNAHKKKDNDN
jgi:hypothetical protein